MRATSTSCVRTTMCRARSTSAACCGPLEMSWKIGLPCRAGIRITRQRSTRSSNSLVKESASAMRPEAAILLAILEVGPDASIRLNDLEPAVRIGRRGRVAAIVVYPVNAAAVRNAAGFDLVADLDRVERSGHALAVLLIARREDVVDSDIVCFAVGIALDPQMRMRQLHAMTEHAMLECRRRHRAT